MKDDWKKELARDFIALGGIPFFILVVVRIWILDNSNYLLKIIISGILFLILSFLFKGDIYSGLALIVLVFTGIHYADSRYWIFVCLAYVFLLGGLIYLDKEKKKIFIGVLIGLLTSRIGYWISEILFK